MILVTGNNGYIGPVMTETLQKNSFRVVGMDSNLFKGCEAYDYPQPEKQIVKDIRRISEDDLRGVESIIHLAALSNDPLGELSPNLTNDINYLASVRIAKLAKRVGVERFVYASSCSLYGISDEDKPISESGKLNPITAYAKSKIQTEMSISELADEKFHPVFMRNSTVYGMSPNLRLDLVVNNLTASAFLTGKITIMSDGTPWRPLLHIKDFCRAFVAAIKSPEEKIHNQAFNVGLTEENYQIRHIAKEVKKIIPNSDVEILNKTGSDERSYRVDFSKINEILPGFNPKWNLRRGIAELYEAYKSIGLTKQDLESPKYFRVKWIKKLIDNGDLDNNLYWKR